MAKKLPTLAVALLGIFLISTTTLIILPFVRISPTYAKNFPSLNYVALGDSITYGAGVTTPAYPSKYKDFLSADLGVPVSLTNLGVPFWYSSNLLYALKNNQTYKDAVKNANLVTVDIGTNNFRAAKYLYDQGTCYTAQYNNNCLTFIANNFTNDLNAIIAQIKLLNASPSNVTILLSDIYNPDTSLYNQTTAAIFIPYATQINNIIHSIATTNSLGVTSVYQAFNGVSHDEDPIAKGYVLPPPDGVHPSDQGHNVIAAQFRTLNSYILAKDTDADGFINSREKYLGTDILAGCPTTTSHNAYPPDLNNSGRVDVADILAVSQQGYGKDTSSPDWLTKYKRMDFDMTGKITVNDILAVSNLYYTGFC